MSEYWNNEEESEEDFLEDFPPYDIDELTKEDILSDDVINYLISIMNPAIRLRQYEAVKEKARKFKITKSFTQLYNLKDNQMGAKNLEERQKEGLKFPEMNGIVYKSDSYELDKQTNGIYIYMEKLGKFLVCYHPVLPIELYKNLEDGKEKIKLAFYKNNKWEYIITDKSIISSNQKIVNLSDYGISVTSENAKFLVKYLNEIENLNKDKIKIENSVSRLGWFGDVLIPYSNKYEFDNEQEMPNLRKKFAESGNLEDWVNFLKEKRKYNVISRIVMAAGISSILLKDLKQSGFTVHIYGESETRKNRLLYGSSIDIW